MTARRIREPYPCLFSFGWIMPGTFARLAVHLGFILAWLNARLPHPFMIVATSAGAITAACCVSFNRSVVCRVAHIMKYLHRGQIYTLSHGLLKTGVFLLVAGAMLVLTAASAGSLGPWWATALIGLAAAGAYVRFLGTARQLAASIVVLVIVVAAASWKSGGWVSGVLFCAALLATHLLVRSALHVFFTECESLTDNTPLRNLLLNERVAQNAFRAETELSVLATDVAKPECVAYSNHEPLLCDPENSEHCEQFTDGVLNSAALPARFQARVVRGRKTWDGEIWTDFGIRQFADTAGKPRVKLVFRLDYWEPLGEVPVPKTIVDIMLVTFDRGRDRCTILKRKGLEALRANNPDLPRIVDIRASGKLLAMMPNIAVHNFKPGDLWRAMKFGRAVLRENLPLIRRELSLDESEPEAAPCTGN